MGSELSRSSREKRGYQMVVAGGVSGTVAVVGFVLAVVGVIGFGIPLLAAIIAAVCYFVFRRTVS
ncbi:MAG: hypothetical protein H0V29_14270 [Thermoleophilaceae bacterium]|nr:hypothetical protein [Thermoleophilaceae bacterium]